MKKIIIFTLLILFSATIFAKKPKEYQNFWKVFVEHPNKENYEKCKKGFKTICSWKKLGYEGDLNSTKKQFTHLIREGNEWAVKLASSLFNFYPNADFCAPEITKSIWISIEKNPKLYLQISKNSQTFWGGEMADLKGLSKKQILNNLNKKIKILETVKDKNLTKVKKELMEMIIERKKYALGINQYGKNINNLIKQKDDFLKKDDLSGFFNYFFALKKDYFRPFLSLSDLSDFFIEFNPKSAGYKYNDFVVLNFLSYLNYCNSKKLAKKYDYFPIKNIVNDANNFFKLKFLFGSHWNPFLLRNLAVKHPLKKQTFVFLTDSHIKNISKESLDMVSKVYLKYNVCNLVKDGYCKNQIKKMNETFEKWKKQKKTTGQQKIFKEISKEFEYYKKKLKNDHKCYEKDYCFYSQDFIFSNK